MPCFERNPTKFNRGRILPVELNHKQKLYELLEYFRSAAPDLINRYQGCLHLDRQDRWKEHYQITKISETVRKQQKHAELQIHKEIGILL